MVTSARTRVALAMAVALGTLPACGGADAPVTVSPAEYDFGRVLEGEQRRHTFTLTNHSHRTVAFTAKATCGCFAVSRDLRPLDPGQSLEFHVLFTTAGRQGPVRGKWVEIDTDHPEVPKIIVPLTGEVFRAFTVRPALFNYGQIDGREENYDPRKVVVEPQEGCSLRYLGFFSTPQVVDVSPETLEDGALALTLRLRKDVQRPQGPFLAQVRFDLAVTTPDAVEKRQHPVVHLRGFWSR